MACDRAANQPASAENVDPATPDTAQASPPEVKVKRVGSVIGLKKEKRDYYNELHANPWPEINAMLKKCNVRNYSIYECELDGKLYLFSYFEYVGDDYEKDMAAMAADPKIQEWWAETDPCQIRLPGTPEGQQWKTIEQVYLLD
ncbi:MAG: L-rhamnose mutarotase [Pirellulaceae bacterium]|nr:L-rhamnose mutarotase [Pirellulaceae bacterium]